METKIAPRADFLFELSWEVCNKVGGIYTVLESKAAQMVRYYGANYYLIGPFFAEKAKGQFLEEKPGKDLEAIFASLEGEGIKCRFGAWLIPGEPKAILLDFAGLLAQKDTIKGEIWETYKIDSLGAGFDFDEPVIFSWAAGKLIEVFGRHFSGKKIVVQFHEWLTGSGLLYLKKNKVKAGTVFTTHATVLGRSLANSGVPLYSVFGKIDPEEEAYKYHVQAKHQMERNTAHYCDVFTALSEINALEAEKFLGRKPDMLLPDGLDIGRFPDIDKMVTKQLIQGGRIKEFAAAYFFPYYPLELENALFFFTVGRYEFRNKGIDMFVKSLGALNRELKKEPTGGKTVIVFIWVPAATQGVRPEIMESLENYRDIKDSFEEISGETEGNLLRALISGKKPAGTDVLDREFLKTLERKLLKFRKSGLPPPSTHILSDANDIVLRSLVEEGLRNGAEDRVKVIFYPAYMTGSDGLLNLDYYEGIEACDLGVFPSFYEPWGYTPLEAAALGVASVTTDLAGVGRFLLKQKASVEPGGIYVVKRDGIDDKEAAKALSDILARFYRFSEKELGEEKIRARRWAALADWKILIKNYVAAHNQSLS